MSHFGIFQYGRIGFRGQFCICHDNVLEHFNVTPPVDDSTDSKKGVENPKPWNQQQKVLKNRYFEGLL